MKKTWLKFQIQEISLIFFISLSIYSICAYGRLGRASQNNHFAYLAQSFLAGQSHLLTKPPHGNDWASYERLNLSFSAQKRLSHHLGRQVIELKGIYLPKQSSDHLQKHSPQVKHNFRTLKGELIKIHHHEVLKRSRLYYVSFPPLPALLMLPFVAIFGLAASDVWFTLIFAALNVVIAYSSFKLILDNLSSNDRSLGGESNASPLNQPKQSSKVNALWLATSLCFGSAHLWCAVRGEVWFTALIIGVTCQLLFFRWAWHLRRPLLAGLAYAAAFSTRASLVILALFAYAQIFSIEAHINIKERIRKLVIFSIPPLCIGLCLLTYNYIRFEAWTEFGHSYLAGGQIGRIHEYGLFHWVFFKKNVIAAFALLPLLSITPPFFTYSWHGMSMFFSTPQVVFLAQRKARSPNSLKLLKNALVACTVLIFLLLLFYQNTGWVQYSWRFGLDILPALTLIFLIKRSSEYKLFRFMVLWGVLINLWGAMIFGRYSPYWSAIDLPKLFPH
ncbi:MAG: hypothetical protein CMH49_02305 [Myxococcales bacterium]|nr:hypothetical protein [Myxococcales bacterium]